MNNKGIKIIRCSRVLGKYKPPWKIIQQHLTACCELKVLRENATCGPCVETDFNPEFLRPHLAAHGISIKVRQLAINKFRYWRTT